MNSYTSFTLLLLPVCVAIVDDDDAILPFFFSRHRNHLGMMLCLSLEENIFVHSLIQTMEAFIPSTISVHKNKNTIRWLYHKWHITYMPFMRSSCDEFLHYEKNA